MPEPKEDPTPTQFDPLEKDDAPFMILNRMQKTLRKEARHFQAISHDP